MVWHQMGGKAWVQKSSKRKRETGTTVWECMRCGSMWIGCVMASGYDGIDDDICNQRGFQNKLLGINIYLLLFNIKYIRL